MRVISLRSMCFDQDLVKITQLIEKCPVWQAWLHQTNCHGCTLPPLPEINLSQKALLRSHSHRRPSWRSPSHKRRKWGDLTQRWGKEGGGHSLNADVNPCRARARQTSRNFQTNSDNLLALPFHLNPLAGHTFQNDFVMGHKFLEKDFTMRITAI